MTEELGEHLQQLDLKDPVITYLKEDFPHLRVSQLEKDSKAAYNAILNYRERHRDIKVVSVTHMLDVEGGGGSQYSYSDTEVNKEAREKTAVLHKGRTVVGEGVSCTVQAAERGNKFEELVYQMCMASANLYEDYAQYMRDKFEDQAAHQRDLEVAIAVSRFLTKSKELKPVLRGMPVVSGLNKELAVRRCGIIDLVFVKQSRYTLVEVKTSSLAVDVNLSAMRQVCEYGAMFEERVTPGTAADLLVVLYCTETGDYTIRQVDPVVRKLYPLGAAEVNLSPINSQGWRKEIDALFDNYQKELGLDSPSFSLALDANLFDRVKESKCPSLKGMRTVRNNEYCTGDAAWKTARTKSILLYLAYRKGKVNLDDCKNRDDVIRQFKDLAISSFDEGELPKWVQDEYRGKNLFNGKQLGEKVFHCFEVERRL